MLFLCRVIYIFWSTVYVETDYLQCNPTCDHLSRYTVQALVSGGLLFCMVLPYQHINVYSHELLLVPSASWKKSIGIRLVICLYCASISTLAWVENAPQRVSTSPGSSRIERTQSCPLFWLPSRLKTHNSVMLGPETGVISIEYHIGKRLPRMVLFEVITPLIRSRGI